jgi:hypothetical protein
MTTDTAAALRSKQRATEALVSALAPFEDAAGFAALWTLVRAYGAACQALGTALARDCADGDETDQEAA